MEYRNFDRVLLKPEEVKNIVFTDANGISFVISDDIALEMFTVLDIGTEEIRIYNESLNVGEFWINVNLIDGPGFSLRDKVRLKGGGDIYTIVDFLGYYVVINLDLTDSLVEPRALTKVEKKIVETWKIVGGEWERSEEECYE